MAGVLAFAGDIARRISRRNGVASKIWARCAATLLRRRYHLALGTTAAANGATQARAVTALRAWRRHRTAKPLINLSIYQQ
jgi:hypothetical protein